MKITSVIMTKLWTCNHSKYSIQSVSHAFLQETLIPLILIIEWIGGICKHVTPLSSLTQRLAFPWAGQLQILHSLSRKVSMSDKTSLYKDIQIVIDNNWLWRRPHQWTGIHEEFRNKPSDVLYFGDGLFENLSDLKKYLWNI